MASTRSRSHVIKRFIVQQMKFTSFQQARQRNQLFALEWCDFFKLCFLEFNGTAKVKLYNLCKYFLGVVSYQFSNFLFSYLRLNNTAGGWLQISVISYLFLVQWQIIGKICNTFFRIILFHQLNSCINKRRGHKHSKKYVLFLVG